MPADLTTYRTYFPPPWEYRMYKKQYDAGFAAAVRGEPENNPYPTEGKPFSRVQDLRSYWWQAGYSDYEGA